MITSQSTFQSINPPRDNTPVDDRYVVIHLNKADKNCLVKRENSRYAIICELADWLIQGIQVSDFVKLSTAVNGKPIVTDYYPNTEEVRV